MNKPNFFIIGAPKSGTTSLSEYLRTHPNVFFSGLKEPAYFATDFKHRLVTTEKVYLKLFQAADPALHQAIGEGTTRYLFSTEAISNILEFQPNAKFIAMLRNPTDMVASFHNELLKTGTENIVDFLDAWNAEDDRRSGKRIPLGCVEPKLLYYSEWGGMGSQLERVLNCVPRNKLKIIVFDDFVQDALAIYREVLAFLEIPDDGRNDFPVINEFRQPRSQFLPTIIGIIMSRWLPLRVKMFRGKGFGIAEYLTKLNSTSHKKRLTPEVRFMLNDFYKEEILLLGNLINRNLMCWQKKV